MRTPSGSLATVDATAQLFPSEAHELLAAGGRIALAVALGLLAASVIRRRRLHWSWTAPALVTALVAEPIVGPGGGLAIVACAIAAVRARRRHREDLEAGADLARSARARLTPLDAARQLGARLADAAEGDGRGLAGARPARPNELILGRDPHGRAVRLPFEDGVGGHMLVVGATGAGKTVTQTLIAERAIEDGRAVIVVDPKGDAAMKRRLAEAAARAGRRLTE